eukprot:jgi/Psemu1/55193/gm1.55193_g
MGMEPANEPHPTTPVTTSLSAPDLNGFRQNAAVSLRPRTATTKDVDFGTPTAAANLRQSSNGNASRDLEAKASTLYHHHHHHHHHHQHQPNSSAPPGASKSGSASQTLAALFGGPGAIAAGTTPILGATLAAQHDYTLVGDSPYETTYDPRSPYYYNRVYGQLYITTVSVMFRGKAFGPIGAIPYERRLLLPFVEVLKVEAYRTTSLKVYMNDGEQYVFKSFADREAVVKLLKRTHKRCCGGIGNGNGNGNGSNISNGATNVVAPARIKA